MAESVINVGVESTVEYSSKVTPIFDDETSSTAEIKSKEQAINVSEISSVLEVQDSRIVTMPEDNNADERNPQDRWLPITESRNGSVLTATFHLLCSGIGVQALLLPLAFVSLGWFWGILCLSVAYSWQLYTTWLLVNLHESSPQTGIRYSRFLHLSIVAFGEKLGKLLAIFPTLYLSSGTCIIYIITGGTIMELFFKSMCENNAECEAKTLTGAEWFLVFILLAIFIAQFFPNLNSLASISLIGSIAALVYVCILCVMSVTKGRPDHGRPMEAVALHGGDTSGIRNVFNGFGIIALAFRGHNLVLEIQGTIPTNRKQPSRKSMWRGVIISYLFIAMSMYPLAIVGYWAYGHQVPIKGGILSAFTYFHQKSTSKYIIGAIYLIIIINYLCAFQIYAMPAFDNFERIYTSNKNKPCPRWLRSAIKVMFGGLTYFIAVAFPFLPRLGAFVGSIGLPLTLVYPCLMWVAIKKPGRFSRMWCLNLGLGFSGIVLSVVCFSAALWSLIVNGLEANFFKPR
ncbi:hypothetical protein DH2020_047582 [Rehmannia glutinosa]|uniref:Amino acid transporter transmembrane domain-containing protein n=1 Tax=Rehmannia glutinosa TaxID=99300 RepID=A0ABR0U863_REHGL